MPWSRYRLKAGCDTWQGCRISFTHACTLLIDQLHRRVSHTNLWLKPACFYSNEWFRSIYCFWAAAGSVWLPLNLRHWGAAGLTGSTLSLWPYQYTSDPSNSCPESACGVCSSPYSCCRTLQLTGWIIELDVCGYIRGCAGRLLLCYYVLERRVISIVELLETALPSRHMSFAYHCILVNFL